MGWRIDELGWRILPGGLVSLAFAALLSLGVLQPLEQIAYGALFRLRGEQPWDDRLAVIAIDDASLKKLGRFPWTRQRYAQLLNVLTKADAGVVVFDLIWSEPSPDDERLAAAMGRNGYVVLAQGWDNTNAPLLPVVTLQQSAIARGHILKQQDADGITRSVELQRQGEPILGLAAIRAFSLVQDPVSLPKLDQPFWINWAGQAQQIRYYSFADVLEEKVALQELQDKIVLVGVTAAGMDPLPTPFDQNPPASGVYLQATIVNNLLQQNPLHPPSPVWIPLILLLGGPGLSLLLSSQREERQALIWFVICCGWGAVVIYAFSQTYWLPLALPLCLVTTTAGVVSVSERLKMGAILKQQVQQLWQLYQHDLGGWQPNRSAHSTRQSLGSFQSATQLTALAEQLGRSQSTQAAIARSLSIGLLAADWDGRVWFCNPVAAHWVRAEVGSRLTASLVPEWLTETDWQADLQTLKQQMPVPPRELQRGDRWFALKLEPLMYHPPQADTPPTLDGLLVVLEDITPQKQAETALEHQVQELQHIAQLKDDFLSTVSHELRSPMANMKMAIELLKIAKSSESAERYLNILQTECAREIELINDLLDLQRLEAGAQTYNATEINLQTWLPQILAPFHERAENQQQILQVHLPPHLPPFISDPASLERIVVELVTNACKYTPIHETITVAASLNPASLERNTGETMNGNSSSPSHSLQFSVCNSGVEIPAAEIEQVFEKFYRIPKSDPWKRGGTGLGLALVKKLVESLGGNIGVVSDSGQTRFTVQLPLTLQK